MIRRLCTVAVSAAVVLAGCSRPSPRETARPARPSGATPSSSPLATAREDCRGTGLDWATARSACRCDPHCVPGSWQTVRAEITSVNPSIASGRVLELTVRYVNDGASPATLMFAEHARLEVRDEQGSVVFPRSWSTSSGQDWTPCVPAPVGEVAPHNAGDDLVEVVLLPGGTMTERLDWHAGIPERERTTCGWNYAPLHPGRYRLSTQEPVPSKVLDVTVTPVEACVARCPCPAGALALPFAKHPELARVGGVLRVDAPGYTDPVCKQNALVIAHAASGVVAVSGACTDECCPVTFDGALFQCPWCKRTESLRGRGVHSGWPDGSETYGLDGGIVGPERSVPALPRLDVCEDECGVIVSLPAR